MKYQIVDVKVPGEERYQESFDVLCQPSESFTAHMLVDVTGEDDGKPLFVPAFRVVAQGSIKLLPRYFESAQAAAADYNRRVEEVYS